jgi:hypothetical protein
VISHVCVLIGADFTKSSRFSNYIKKEKISFWT